MKKYRHRPALRAIDVLRWVNNDILQVDRVKSTPVLILLQGKHVRQTWLKKTSKRIVKKTAVSYLRKGSFLVPIWQNVPDWEIEYRKNANLNPQSQGIIELDNRYLRLAFMQDEDIDHAQRQQEHVLDQYLNENPVLGAELQTIIHNLLEESVIVDKIAKRKIGLEKFSAKLKIELRSHRRSVKSIVEYSPLFKKNASPKERQTALNALAKIGREIRKIAVRPVGTRLKRASNSIGLAIANIKKSQFKSAKRCLESALKNLDYPEPS